MIPAIGGTAEAIPLCNNVEEYEQALFNTNVDRELRLDIVQDPVGQIHKRELVHMGEILESVWDAHQQGHCPLRARRILSGHVVWKW